MTAFDRGHEPLLTGPSRAPIWPRRLIGSITHCEEYGAAAVADTKDLIAIGVDAEPWRGMSLDIKAHIATDHEYLLWTRLQMQALGSGLIAATRR